MARHIYFVNYGRMSGRQWGEGMCPVNTDGPIDSFDMVLEISRSIGDRYHNGEQVVVRNWQLLRTED